MSEVLTPINFSDIPRWRNADLNTALAAFQRSAAEILLTASGFRRVAQFGGTVEDWREACNAAQSATHGSVFFEQYFRAFRVQDPTRPEGLFTGYYEPLLQGAMAYSETFPVPVYARPIDLVSFNAEETEATGLSYGRKIAGHGVPYDTRQDIENGSIKNRAEVICWVSSWVDAFFMHVQGQGRVAFEDGSTLRLSYAAKSGHAYTGIGHVLIEQGVAPPNKMSMQVLRDWMNKNPAEARELMWKNKSYIFFQATIVDDPSLGGIGAAKVNLTPHHSLAVDRRYWMFGTPLWIETTYPPEIERADRNLHNLMIAQDTGTAIRGVVRGDFFWGASEDAAMIAGHMKSPGNMVALLPLPLAVKLGHIK